MPKLILNQREAATNLIMTLIERKQLPSTEKVKQAGNRYFWSFILVGDDVEFHVEVKPQEEEKPQEEGKPQEYQTGSWIENE